MHKNIAETIKQMVDKSPYNNSLFTCKVKPDYTNGFWAVTIEFIADRKNAHSSALFNSLHDIGMVFGEGLSIEDKGNVVEVS